MGARTRLKKPPLPSLKLPRFEFQSRRPATYVYEGRAGDEERDVQHVKSLGIA